jgi:hypothetical protein
MRDGGRWHALVERVRCRWWPSSRGIRLTWGTCWRYRRKLYLPADRLCVGRSLQ